MRAQNPDKATGTNRPSQKDDSPNGPSPHARDASKKMEQSASTEKKAAATINGPRPNHAANIPGSTQTQASKNYTHAASGRMLIGYYPFRDLVLIAS
jgi:hypothetical protein